MRTDSSGGITIILTETRQTTVREQNFARRCFVSNNFCMLNSNYVSGAKLWVNLQDCWLIKEIMKLVTYKVIKHTYNVNGALELYFP